MSRRLKKLIKRFDLIEDNRRRIVLGANVRLDPKDNHVTLGQVELPPTNRLVFPTDPDLFVRTWATTPLTVKQWLDFEVEIQHAFDDLGNQLTFDGYKLNDGTTDLYWDGAAWSVAGPSDWSTEDDIAANIDTFPVASRTLQVVANLGTNDNTVAPALQTIKILWASDVEFQEDLIYRSLVPELRENIRPIADYPVELAVDSDTIDLANDFPLKTPYNLVDIDSVYDHTNDPNHMTDLFQSFDSGTKVITLSQTLLATTIVWIRFIYEPEVAVTTKRTYIEVGKVPALVISDINGLDSAEANGRGDSVMRKSTGVGTRVLSPLQVDIEFVLRCLTDKARDQHRLVDEIQRYFRQNPLLRSRGLDETYRLWLVDELDQQGLVGQAEIETSRIRFRIVRALFYNRGHEDVTAVKRAVFRGPPDIVVS